MADAGIATELPLSVTGPDGTLVWTGVGYPENIIWAEHSASGSANAVLPGNAVSADASATQFMTFSDTVNRKQYLRAVRCTTAQGCLLGVALDKAVYIAGAGPLGAPFRVCSKGIVPVKSLLIASLTSNAEKALLIASATTGLVNGISQATSPTNMTNWLGRILLPSGTTAGTSGVDGVIIATVNPS